LFANRRETVVPRDSFAFLKRICFGLNEEFYKVTESSFDIAKLREELLEWERIYNWIVPSTC
jgi:hypothetical protein